MEPGWKLIGGILLVGPLVFWVFVVFVVFWVGVGGKACEVPGGSGGSLALGGAPAIQLPRLPGSPVLVPPKTLKTQKSEKT